MTITLAAHADGGPHTELVTITESPQEPSPIAFDSGYVIQLHAMLAGGDGTVVVDPVLNPDSLPSVPVLRAITLYNNIANPRSEVKQWKIILGVGTRANGPDRQELMDKWNALVELAKSGQHITVLDRVSGHEYVGTIDPSMDWEMHSRRDGDGFVLYGTLRIIQSSVEVARYGSAVYGQSTYGSE